MENDILLTIHQATRQTFAALSHYPLPLGLTLGPFLHIGFSVLWTLTCQFCKRSVFFIVAGVTIVAVLKEFYDSFTLQNSFLKHLFDITITITPSYLIVYFTKFKQRF